MHEASRRLLRAPAAGRTAAAVLSDFRPGRPEGGRPRFRARTIAIPGGAEWPYAPEEWRDALVLVERGEVEIVPLAGAAVTFRAGDVLCLEGLRLRGVRATPAGPAVLTTIARRCGGGEPLAPRPSTWDDPPGMERSQAND